MFSMASSSQTTSCGCSPSMSRPSLYCGKKKGQYKEELQTFSMDESYQSGSLHETDSHSENQIGSNSPFLLARNSSFSFCTESAVARFRRLRRGFAPTPVDEASMLDMTPPLFRQGLDVAGTKGMVIGRVWNVGRIVVMPGFEHRNRPTLRPASEEPIVPPMQNRCPSKRDTKRL